MSDTIVDFAKVTQMLDSGWQLLIFKNNIGSYTAMGGHENRNMIRRINAKIAALADEEIRHIVEEHQDDESIETDDFTPQQAATRLAYKIHGEII